MDVVRQLPSVGTVPPPVTGRPPPSTRCPDGWDTLPAAMLDRLPHRATEPPIAGERVEHGRRGVNAATSAECASTGTGVLDGWVARTRRLPRLPTWCQVTDRRKR